MRISTNSIIDPYERALQNIQIRKTKEQMKLTTGKENQELADNPKSLMNAKNLTALIDRNETFGRNIDTGLNEMALIDEELRAMTDKLTQIRQTVIDSTQVGNSSNLYPLGVFIRSLMEDIIRDANQDYNGHYLFSGTKTTPSSIDANAKSIEALPFQIIKGEPSEENWSGWTVNFRGNNEDRIINKDSVTTEVINVKANKLFGGKGDEVFKSIIGLFNLLSYNKNGEVRGENDLLTKEDISKLNVYQKNVANAIHSIDSQGAVIGAKYNHLDNVRQQMKNELVLLKDFRSMEEDTDVAKATLNLRREENALQYTLTIGARIIQQSLFDFIR